MFRVPWDRGVPVASSGRRPSVSSELVQNNYGYEVGHPLRFTSSSTHATCIENLEAERTYGSLNVLYYAGSNLRLEAIRPISSVTGIRRETYLC